MQAEKKTAYALQLAFKQVLRRRSHGLVVADTARSVAEDFASSIVAGMLQQPRRLDCRFLYDSRGSSLFEQITRQPEYYLTRVEAGILQRSATDIARLTGPVSLLELGSGSAAKTSHLLAAYAAAGCPVLYVPVDVSDAALRSAVTALARQRSGVRIVALRGTYETGLALLPELAPVMVVFLGSTIGNLDERQAEALLGAVAAQLAPGSFMLLGVDLVKERPLLEAAYNDAAGVTAAFTLNIFARMQAELQAKVDLDGIEHRARWSSAREQIEIHAAFTRPQTIELPLVDRHFALGAGEDVLVEVSRKFRPAALAAALESLGWKVRATYSDDRRWFAVFLLERRAPSVPAL